MFPPLVVVKPLVLLTVRLTVPVCPCFTLNVSDDPRLELRVFQVAQSILCAFLTPQYRNDLDVAADPSDGLSG